jgi:heme exporter protein D
MNWNSPAEFFAMGGYGFYVWGSYAVTLALMLAEPWLARRRHRQALADAADASNDGSQA